MMTDQTTQQIFEISNPQVSQSENLFSLIKSCVDPAEVKIAKDLILFSATDIDKLVKFKPGEKERFKKELLVKKEKQKKQQDEQIQKYHFDGVSKTIQKLSQNLEKVKISNFRDYDSLEFIKQKEQIIIEALKQEMLYKETTSVDNLQNQVEIMLRDQECQNKEKLIHNLLQGKLIKYIDYDWQNPKKFKLFLKRLQALPLYQSFKKYFCLNFQQIKRNFKKDLRNKLSTDKAGFSIKKIQLIQNLLLKNPLENWQNLPQLSQVQKQALYKICWQNSKLLEEYALIHQKPQSLDQQVLSVVQKMMDFILDSGKLNEKEYLQISQAIQSIKNFESRVFYMIPSISNHRKTIYQEFRKKAGPYYFYKKQLNQHKCKSAINIKFCLNLRNFLHDLQIHSSLYVEIESCLLKNNLIQLWKIQLSNQARRAIIKYYYQQQLCKQHKSAFDETIPLRILAEVELEKIAIQCDFRNPTFIDIKKAISIFINSQMLYGFKLIPEQQKEFMEHYEKSNYAKKYIENFKIDESLVKKELKQKLIYIFSEIPNSVSYDTVVKTIEDILTNCETDILWDSKDLTQNQKSKIYQQLIKSQEYKKFSDAFLKLNAIKAQQNLKEAIQKKFGICARTIQMFYSLYGQFELDKDDKVINQFSYFSEQNMLENAIKDKDYMIKQIQQTSDYHVFQRLFDLLFNQKKQNTQLKLLSSIRTLMINYNMPFDLYVEQVQKGQFNLESFNTQLKQRIKVQPAYNQFLDINNAASLTKKKRKMNKFTRFINSIHLHQQLRKYLPQERKQVINGILSHGCNFLDETELIRQLQKKKIRQLINNFECPQDIQSTIVFSELKNFKSQSTESTKALIQLSNIQAPISVAKSKLPFEYKTEEIIINQMPISVAKSKLPFEYKTEAIIIKPMISENQTSQTSLDPQQKLVKLIKDCPAAPKQVKKQIIYELRQNKASIFENLDSLVKKFGIINKAKKQEMKTYLEQNKDKILSIINEMSNVGNK